MSTITDFLRQYREQHSSVPDPRKREEWLQAVNGLYQQIRSWLVQAEKEKLIQVRPEGTIKLIEEGLGEYDAPCLTLAVGSQVVRLKPIGRNIIGANGRVDMISPRGTFLFLYIADQKKWVHGHGKRPADFQELNESLFSDLLQRALA